MTTEPPLLARHLGCGDGLCLSGGAIELAKEFGSIRFASWYGHVPTFQEIFKDHPEVEVVSVQNEYDMFSKQRSMILTGRYKKPYDYWTIGPGEKVWRNSGAFDQQFYAEIGVPLQKKWDSFPWKYEGEPVKYDKPYIYVHDDASRGYIMDLDRIGRHWTQDMMVTPDRELRHPLTWWAPFMMGAHEIHTINTCSLWLADLIDLPEQQRKYFHRYAKQPWEPSDNPTLRHNWIILD